MKEESTSQGIQGFIIRNRKQAAGAVGRKKPAVNNCMYPDEPLI
jgi:hypothetical protein